MRAPSRVVCMFRFFLRVRDLCFGCVVCVCILRVFLFAVHVGLCILDVCAFLYIVVYCCAWWVATRCM